METERAVLLACQVAYESKSMSTRCDGHGEPVGVVLFQLGGPDSLESVEPFLENLFSDPDIIDFPFARLARPALARLIASRRAKHARQHYASIGGKSPLRELTDLQARALESELRKSIAARVFVAMRYWHPSTEEVAREVDAQPFRNLVLLPLYPQYSKTTTGSSFNEWNRRYRPEAARKTPVRVVRQFYDHPGYLDAVVEKINQGLAWFGGVDSRQAGERQAALLRATLVVAGAPHGPVHDVSGAPHSDCAESRPNPQAATASSVNPSPYIQLAPGKHLAPDVNSAPDIRLIFSAHGVPQSVIEAGDPYQEQVEATVELVMSHGGWRNPYALCYQSRVGPGRWLAPSLCETLVRLAREGAARVLVIPIAFVSEHVETLSEIGIEARELAYRLGIRQFEVMPALNDSPKFIQALAELVLGTLDRSA